MCVGVSTCTVPKWYIRILQWGAHTHTHKHTHTHSTLLSDIYDAGYMMMDTYVRRDVVVWDDVRTYCGGGAWDSEREISLRSSGRTSTTSVRNITGDDICIACCCCCECGDCFIESSSSGVVVTV